MCGIAGVVGWGDERTVGEMTAVQSHRGPDDQGLWNRQLSDGSHWALGSARLAIQDLSPAGHMPMANEDETVWITFNGEIYNFRQLRKELVGKGHLFRSTSDTEVILHLYEEYGHDCVNRLDGMFAFGIVDLRESAPLLFLARDHFGVKPLYYVQDDIRFAFASEAKSFLCLPGFRAELDLDSLHRYLTLLWVPDPRTMFRGVSKLPAGHRATFRDGKLKIDQYWDLRVPRDGAASDSSEDELIGRTRELLAEAVRSQMVADVPVGAFLSAGLDSSSIVAMMTNGAHHPVKTYTITFPERYLVGEPTLDDPHIAARTAKRFRCDHHEIVVQPDVAELLPRLVWHMDEPVGDPAIVTAHLVSREAGRDLKVLLSGIGGDELFAGYRKYYALYWMRAYRRLPSPLRDRLTVALELMSFRRGSRLRGFGRLARKMARSTSLPDREAFLMTSTYLDEGEKAALYSEDLKERSRSIDPFEQHLEHFDRVADAHFLDQMLYVDIKTFMVSLNLSYNDKMSMASSVETRVPFLDRTLAEFVALNVPPSLKLRGFWRPVTKYLLRRAMEGALPREVLSQKKAGFGAPVDRWVAEDLHPMVTDLLSPSRIRSRGLFDPLAVQALVDQHQSGRSDRSMQIWQLITLELWMQAFLDAPVPEAVART